MERVRGKLHSRTGASMLIALLFFLVAMTVGAVVLTAASANAVRVKRNQQEQQKYLAVASAAELVKEDLKEESFTGIYDDVEEEIRSLEYDEEGKPHIKVSREYWKQFNSGDTKVSTDSKLLSTCEDVFKRIYDSTLPEGTRNRLAWSGELSNAVFKLNFSAVNIPNVTGELRVQAIGDWTYGLTVVLQAKEPGEEEEPGSNITTIYFAPNIKTEHRDEVKIIDSDTTQYITHHITTVTWAEPIITKGAQP